MIRIEPLSSRNFSAYSLDAFERRQEVRRVYQKSESGYALVDSPFVENWDLAKKHDVASDLMNDEYVSYLALDGEKIVGFIGLAKELVEGYMILDVIQVTEAFRGQGIGRKLFRKGVEEARKAGAKGLYISACPSEETIAFYRAMGSELADPPIRKSAEEEPFDLQMVCDVRK